MRAVTDGLDDVVVFDAATLSGLNYLLEGDRLQLGEFVVEAQAISRGWVRRLAPAEWGHGVPSGSHAAVSQAARISLLAAIARLPSIEWLTGIDP